jgi:hypothetical protein
VDFASITIYGVDQTLSTAAVTKGRFVLINEMATCGEFPRYAPRAAELGVGAQGAVQLVQGKQRAGPNLYARTPKLRVLAQHVIEAAFESTPGELSQARAGLIQRPRS